MCLMLVCVFRKLSLCVFQCKRIVSFVSSVVPPLQSSQWVHDPNDLWALPFDPHEETPIHLKPPLLPAAHGGSTSCKLVQDYFVNECKIYQVIWRIKCHRAVGVVRTEWSSWFSFLCVSWLDKTPVRDKGCYQCSFCFRLSVCAHLVIQIYANKTRQRCCSWLLIFSISDLHKHAKKTEYCLELFKCFISQCPVIPAVCY